MDLQVIKFMEEVVSKGDKVVLVTITEKIEGAPGSVGQIMAVDITGKTMGTVGGGTAEFLLIKRAIEAINNNEKVFDFDFDLKEKGMICGGELKGNGIVFGKEEKLVLFGAGHISQCIYNILRKSEFHITIIDDREEYKNRFDDGLYLDMSVEEASEKINYDQNTYVLVCTRGHNYDYEALESCIKKPCAYIGMIGSKKKVGVLFDKLLKNNVEKEYIDKVYSPVGIAIDNGTPVEIAVSIVAEILKIKNKGSLIHMKEKNKPIMEN